MHQPVGRRTHENRPRRRQALQLAGLMQGITNRRIELLQRRGETTNDHRSRVQPNPGRMGHTKGLDKQALGEFEGCQHSTSSMILLPNRGTKHGSKILARDI